MLAMNVSPGFFKPINRFMVLMHRLGLGPYVSSRRVGSIMVLITTGRKSRRRRHNPVNYAWHDGAVYCLAAFNRRADWYRNLVANPQAEVWIGNSTWAGMATEVQDPDEWLRLYREILVRSGFAAPTFMGVDPQQMTDEALRQLGAGVPIMRIQLERELSAPADLLWVWGALLVGWWLLRPKGATKAR